MSAAIYALLDESECVRYVGKANDPAKRLVRHYRDARRRKSPLYSWLNKLISDGKKPGIRVIEWCDLVDWPARERYWIEHFRSSPNGAGLLNLADGGDEPPCTLETRRANGPTAVDARTRTPRAQRLWWLKQQLGMALRRGFVTAATKDKMRQHLRERPDVYSFAAKYL